MDDEIDDIRKERKKYFNELRKKNRDEKDESDINLLKDSKEAIRKDLKKSFD